MAVVKNVNNSTCFEKSSNCKKSPLVENMNRLAIGFFESALTFSKRKIEFLCPQRGHSPTFMT